MEIQCFIELLKERVTYIGCSESCCLVLTDVDTPEPDEKSLITYISSLYDVFPEPPPIHPLYDPVSSDFFCNTGYKNESCKF
jgi:hypothetical protein